MSSSSDPSPDPSSSSAKAAKTITSIISAVTSQRAGSVGRMSGHETYGKLNRPISAALHIKISMNAPGGGGPLRLRSSDPGGGGGGLKHALPTSSFNLSAKSVNRSNAAFTSFTSIPSPLPSPLSSPLSSIVSSLSLLFMSSSSDPSPDPSSSSAKAAKTITSIISAVTSQREGSTGRVSGHETYGKLNRPISH